MKKFVILCVALVFTGFIAKSQTFTDQIAGSGLERVDKIAEIRELFDFNNDGFEDIIYSTKTAAALLYKNNGNGTFTDVSSVTNFPVFSTEVSSIICTDLDNNGFKDVVYYLNHGGSKVNDTLRIFMNYDASFVEKTTAFGIVNPILHGTNHFCTNIMPVDFDKDGDLDILFASTNRTATNACTDSKVAVLENKLNNPTSPTLNTVVELLSFPVNIFPAGLSVTDYNNDQFADIAVCEQSGTKGTFDGYRADPFFLYKNNGNATFTKVTGAGLADASTHNFITVLDYNNDGLLDFLNGTSDCCGTVLNILWKNNGNGTYTDMRSTYNLHPVNDYYGRLSAVDFNNDGNFDISTTGMGGFWSDTRIQLWENNGSTFTNTAATYGLQIGYNGGFKGLGNNSVWFDYDNDGDLDFYSQNWNSGLNYLQSLMKNPNTSLNKYLRIKLVGTFSPKDGTGSRVVLKIGTKKLTQYSNGTIGNNQSDIFHFGVGQNATIDSLCVYWSSGNVTRMANVSANQLLTITEHSANRITDYIQQASRYGSANDQDPAGMYISNGWLYIVGNDAGQSLLMKYPVEDINTPVWSIIWPNVVSGGGEMFTGVTSDENGIYAAGWSYSQTTDNSGGKEIKPVLCKFPLNGATGTGTGGVDWIAKPALFPYQGYEGFNDDILNIEEGIRYIYACGTPQANGNNNTAVLTKYDTNNNLIWKEVMGNTTSGHFNTANSISILNNNVYTAGSSDSHITLWKSDQAGNLTWEKSTEITVNSGLNAICSSGEYLFAAGYEQTTGQGKNVVILKYDENGNVIWKTLWGGSLDEIAHGIEFFDNKVLVVGETSSYGAGGKDAFIFQLNAEDGAMNDSVFYGGSLDDIAVKIKKDNNTVYISGSFQGDAAFETFTLHSSGAKDIFILKMKGGENEKVYNITAGSLSTALTETEKATITNLVLTGTIDARDVKCMRDELIQLTNLDISGVNILAYNGTDGPYPSSFSYPANEMPKFSFKFAVSGAKTSLKTIKFPNTMTSIGSSALYTCSGLTGNLWLPGSVTSIANDAFSGCNGLTGNLTLPDSLITIGNNAFLTCTGFTGDLTIPNTVTSIGSSAFSYCTGFDGKLTIPNSVSSIAAGAFYSCSGLTSIYAYAPIPINLSSSTSVFNNINKTTCTLYVPNGSKAAYQVANQWQDFMNIVEMSETNSINITAGSLSTTLTETEKATLTRLKLTGTIDARDFKTMRDNMPLLADVDLSGTSILEYTGTEGTQSTSIKTYPANTIPRTAFYIQAGKISLTNFICPNNITAIARSAFNKCGGLISIDIPPTVNSIGYAAFNYCSSLNSVNIPQSVTLIDTATFANCTSLTHITIPTAVTSIRNSAFYNCSKLSSVSFGPASLLNTIEVYAFGLCADLKYFEILPSVTAVGDVAFLGSGASITVASNNSSYAAVDGVLFNKNMTRLMYCPAMKSGNYDIPSTVTTIAVDAFYNCTGLTAIKIPISVTTLEDWAFENCFGLSEITIPASVTTIMGYAFFNCRNLISIYANAATPVDLSASDSVFNWIDKNRCVLYVPAGSKALYQAAYQWLDFSNIVEQNYKTVTVAAGGLHSALTSTELSIVTNLKIMGIVDARDFKTMRDNMPLLTDLDMNEVVIASYSGTAGPNDGYTEYAANAIPNHAFYTQMTNTGRKTLKTIKLPPTITKIEVAAFTGSSLTSIVLPNGVTTVEDWAFADSELNSVIIPASLSTIGLCSFTYNFLLTSFQVAGDNPYLTTIDGVLFNKMKNTIICYPNGKYVPVYQIPEGVVVVDKSAFAGWSLQQFLIPNTVNTLSRYSFFSCESLTTIDIPASVTFIGESAFNNCKGLTSITVRATTPVDLSSSIDVFLNVNKTTCTLYVPVGSKSAYQAAGQWKDFVNIVEGEGSVIYNVTVPVGTKACYIAGQMNNWTQQLMNKVDDTHYTITIQGASVSQLYKYCSGPGWNYVEINTDGSETPNRNYAASDTVVRWASVYDPSAHTGITYSVTVPDGTKACYIAGQMNNWTQQPMTKIDDTHYTITIQGASVSQLYKYCSGPGWGYVEVNADGSETQDRNYAENDVVVKWASVYDPEIILTNFIYNVTVPAGTKTCFIAGDMNGWTLQLMTKVDETHYKITLPSNSVFEYIYFSGPEWEYRELNASGNYMSRMYAVSDTVAKWESLFDPNVVRVNMTYSVTVPTGTKACYIAGRMNDWSFQEMTKVDDTHYIITLSSHPSFGYKYCSGPSWDFVEVNASGDYTTNRNYSANDVVARWLAVYNPTLIESDWELQTNPDGESVGKIQFVSATEGWIACGSSGNLLHTINGGATWNVVTPFPGDVTGNMSDPALSMSWVNATHGWALKSFTTDTTFNFDIVNGAVIYSTKDGGGNWLKQELPKSSATVTYNISDLQGTWQLHALTTKNLTDILSVGGWMFGTGTIDASGICSFSISKSNGSIKSPIVPMSISSGGVISVEGDEIGFMSIDKSKIFMTGNEDDNGYSFYVMQKQITEVTYNISDLQGTWQWHSLVSGDLTKWAGWLHGIITLDASGNGTLSNKVKSNGSSDMVSAVSMSINANGVITVGGDSHGYLSADKRSLILTMTDGGGGYTLGFGQKVVPDSTYTTSDLQGRWQTHLITTSNPASSLIQKSGWTHGVINLNSDGEGSLNFVDSDGDFSDDDVSLSISSDGLVTTSGRDIHGFMSADKRSVIMTMSEENGGFTLAAMQKDLSVSGDVGLQIQFVDENNGWASVYNMSTGDLKLYHSIDGGSNWNPMTTHGPLGIFYFVDPNNGWSITRYSSDSIKTPEWSISHTTDGGVHWTVQFTDAGNTDYEFNAIQFTDLTHGWVVGHGGKIFKTTNGSDWTAVTNAEISNESNSKSVYFLNANTGWITNEDSSWPAHTILHTTDGGANWTHQDPGFLNGSMFSIFFWDENNGWFTGEQMIGFGTNENFEYDFRGIIGHYKNTDSDLKESLQKNDITIYPNPAAEGFFIEAGEKTSTVSIYNLNGVITLNKQFTGKTYIDIATLPPGMYIVKIINAEGTLEKKLIKK